MPATTSPTAQLLDYKLGDEGGLLVFVQDRRAEGMSWRAIRDAIRDKTSVDVTAETLRSWFPNDVGA